MTTEGTRILLADDHPVFRMGVRALLQVEPDIEVVGEATDGIEAVELAARLQPDLILMDLHMPGLSGVEATRRISEINPRIKVLVLSLLDDDESVFSAMRAGARGYLLKDIDPDYTLQAIKVVAEGGVIFSPAVASRVIHFFGETRASRRTSQFGQLTERELEVLELIAKGFTNASIAEKLVLSPKTVRNHVSSILSKLQVADRAEAIIRAREGGLGER